MKDTLIYALLTILLIFGVLSFFRVPAYEKGAWLIVGALVAGLSGLFGFKFGVHIPKQPDGTTSITKSETPPATPEKEETQK